jgi:hypothetical protein
VARPAKLAAGVGDGLMGRTAPEPGRLPRPVQGVISLDAR